MTRQVYVFGNNVTRALDPSQDAPGIIHIPRVVAGIQRVVWAGWSKAITIDDKGQSIARGSGSSFKDLEPLSTGYDEILGTLLEDGSVRSFEGVISKTSGWKQVVILGTGEIYALTDAGHESAGISVHRFVNSDEFFSASFHPPAIRLPLLPSMSAVEMYAGPSNLILLCPHAVLACGDTRYNVTCSRSTKGYDPEPSLLEHLEGLNVVSVTMGGCRAGAVSDAGDAFIWGKDIDGIEHVELDEEPADVKFLGLGSDFDVMVTDADEVWVRGNNRFGQLGLGQDVKSVDDFTQLHLSTDGSVVGLTVSRWATFITVDTEGST